MRRIRKENFENKEAWLARLESSHATYAAIGTARDPEVDRKANPFACTACLVLYPTLRSSELCCTFKKTKRK